MNQQQVHPLPLVQTHSRDTLDEERLDNNIEIQRSAKNDGNNGVKMLSQNINAIGRSMTSIVDTQEESSYPIAFTHLHFLQQLYQKGIFHHLKNENELNSEILHSYNQSIQQEIIEKRVIVHVSICIMDITNIDVVQETYSIRYRLFIFWHENLAKKASQADNDSYLLSRSEVDEFIEKYPIPHIHVFNQVNSETNDALDIRILGGLQHHTGILLNQSFTTTCRNRFILYDFPFDRQYLHVELGFNDTVSFTTRQLAITMVQFHQVCIPQLEWILHLPLLKRSLPRYGTCHVIVPLLRKPGYYLQNVIAVMLMLTCLSLIVFVFPNDDISGRISVILTLILTFIAFKYSIMASIPKVSYSTILDFYMLSGLAILVITIIFAIIPNFFVYIHHNSNDDDNYSNRNIRMDNQSINWNLFWVSLWCVVATNGALLGYSYYIYSMHQEYHDVIPLPKDSSIIEQMEALLAENVEKRQQRQRKCSSSFFSFFRRCFIRFSPVKKKESTKKPETPWYSYRFSHPWFLVDADPNIMTFLDEEDEEQEDKKKAGKA